MTTPAMTPEMAAALRRPFAAEEIGKLPKVTCGDCAKKDRQCGKHSRRTCRTCKAFVSTAHIHIDYVGHAHVRERLLQVDPSWNWEPVALDHDGLPQLDKDGGLWIRLTVGGVTRLGYGDAPGKRAATKELIGDALRNAAMSFGVALDLWKKETPPVVEQDEAPTPLPDRPDELRAQIAVLARAKRLSVEEVAADFYQWTQGKDIRSASVPVLAEYKAYLEQRSAGES